MLLVDRWAMLMAGSIGVVGRQVGYLNGRIDSCCLYRGALS